MFRDIMELSGNQITALTNMLLVAIVVIIIATICMVHLTDEIYDTIKTLLDRKWKLAELKVDNEFKNDLIEMQKNDISNLDCLINQKDVEIANLESQVYDLEQRLKDLEEDSKW